MSSNATIRAQHCKQEADYPPSSRGVVTSREPLVMKRGGQLNAVEMSYETWGELNADGSNAILLLTGLSPSAHARSSSADPARGWWEEMIGPDLAIDTNRFFVICVNSLGSCFGSTGPASTNPSSGAPYRLDFPELSIEDLADGAHRVVTALGLDQLYAVVGPSMGGLTAAAYAARYTDQVGRLLLISSSMGMTSHGIAVHSLQREAIRTDPAWNEGHYYDENRPLVGMALARKIGMTSYRSASEWESRFGASRKTEEPAKPFGIEFQVEAYLEAVARKFISSFDANCYLYLSRAMDLFDLEGHLQQGEMAPTDLTKIQVIGVNSDTLFPIKQQRTLAARLQEHGHAVHFAQIDSEKGHDAFLVETALFSPIVRRFLTD